MPLRKPQHLGAYTDTALVEGLNGDLVALSRLAEDIGDGNETVLEDELAGGGCTDSELVLFLAEGEAGRIFLDKKCGDALVSGGAVDGGEDDEEAGLLCVGDPELLSIEDVSI